MNTPENTPPAPSAPSANNFADRLQNIPPNAPSGFWSAASWIPRASWKALSFLPLEAVRATPAVSKGIWNIANVTRKGIFSALGSVVSRGTDFMWKGTVGTAIAPVARVASDTSIALGQWGSGIVGGTFDAGIGVANKIGSLARIPGKPLSWLGMDGLSSWGNKQAEAGSKRFSQAGNGIIGRGVDSLGYISQSVKDNVAMGAMENVGAWNRATFLDKTPMNKVPDGIANLRKRIPTIGSIIGSTRESMNSLMNSRRPGTFATV